MGAALLVCRLVLASVFVTAGLAKLADLAGSRQAVAEFGIPESLAPLAGTALPVLELAVAVALIPVVSARFGALGAAGLLLAFCAAIGNALAHGSAPDCHCFGQVHSAPASWRTLARNGALLGVAGFVAIGGWQSAGISATHWVTRVDAPWLVVIAAGLVIAGLIAFQVWFSLQLLAQNGRTLERLAALEARLGGAPGSEPAEIETVDEQPGSGLPLGAPAPAFELAGLDGRRHSLQSLLAGPDSLTLIFTDAACGPCHSLLGDLTDLPHGRLVVIASGDPERNRAKAAEHGLELVLLQEEREVAEAYRVYGTPMAVAVDRRGRIASATVAGAEAITRVLAQGGAPRVQVRHVPAANGNGAGADAGSGVGDPIPSLTLPALDGEPVALAELYRDPTVAIFWNPRCGYCQQMLDGLKAFERDALRGTPRLIVISAGDVDEIREQGIGSPILLDAAGQGSGAFGARGTPMAVLLSEDRIASPVAAGARAVFDLIDAATVALD